jgi:hypothetical protein
MLLAMVVSGVGLSAVPAEAAPAGQPGDFSISSVTSPRPFTTDGPGQTISVKLDNATSNGQLPTNQITVHLDPGDNGSYFNVAPASCPMPSGTDCIFTFAANTSVTVSFTVTPKPGAIVPAGTSKTISGEVDATSSDGGQASKSVTFQINGQALISVSGTVLDTTTGKGIPDALVNLQDSAGHSWTVHAGSTGKYTINGTAAKPISPGSLSIGAAKDKYKTVTATKNAGTSDIKWNLYLTPVAAPVASATPSATPSTAPPSAGASDPASADAGSASPDAGNSLLGQSASDNSSGGGSLIWVILIIGAILILGGGGFIAYLMRRKNDNDDDDDDDGPHGPGGAPVSGAPYAMSDPTALVRSPMSEAPTMMHQMPTQRRGFEQGYGQPGYGETAPGRPPAPRGVDPYAPGYGQPNGYEPTYAAPPGERGYPPANGYPGNRGYGEPGTAVYGQQDGYDAPATQTYGQRGYSTGPDQGYGQNGYGGYGADPGYDQGGYDQGAGYGQQQPGYDEHDYGNHDYGQNGYGQNGYDQNSYGQNGYDQNGYGYGHDQSSYDQGGYDRNGYGHQDYGQHGHGSEGEGGYEQGNGYQPAGYGAQNGYGQEYGQPSHSQPDSYDQGGYSTRGGYGDNRPQSPYPPQQQPTGYRGGYTPPDQRGSVDWLDD